MDRAWTTCVQQHGTWDDPSQKYSPHLPRSHFRDSRMSRWAVLWNVLWLNGNTLPETVWHEAWNISVVVHAWRATTHDYNYPLVHYCSSSWGEIVCARGKDLPFPMIAHKWSLSCLQYQTGLSNISSLEPFKLTASDVDNTETHIVCYLEMSYIC